MCKPWCTVSGALLAFLWHEALSAGLRCLHCQSWPLLHMLRRLAERVEHRQDWKHKRNALLQTHVSRALMELCSSKWPSNNTVDHLPLQISSHFRTSKHATPGLQGTKGSLAFSTCRSKRQVQTTLRWTVLSCSFGSSLAVMTKE